MGDLERLLARALASGTHTLPTPSTALSILSAGRLVLATGVPALDRILRGGFPCRSVSEVCGEAGSGKTQLLLQLLVRSQMSIEHGGLARKAVYICTEGEPPTTRLSQISDAHVTMFPDAFQRGNPLEHVLIEKVHSVAELEQLIETRLPAFLDRMPVGLVVLDSIAAPMRGDENYSAVEDSASRAALLIKLASLLKSHASRHNCAVVVANQVSDVIEPNEHAQCDGGQHQGSERRWNTNTENFGDVRRKRGKVAAMGLAWAQAVNSRVVLQRCTLPYEIHGSWGSCQQPGSDHFGQRAVDVQNVFPVGLRQARLVMSPWAPSGECLYRIAEGGIESVEVAVEEAMSQPRRWTQERGESIHKEPKNFKTFSSEALREGDSYGKPPTFSPS